MPKRHFQFIVFVFVLAALLMTAGNAGAAPKDGPVVTISTTQSEYIASQEVLINVTISNPTRHAVRVLKWFTPAEGVEEPLFTVTRDGEPVPYIGAIYKRPAATGKDYIALKAGESLVRTVNLADSYDATVTRMGWSAAQVCAAQIGFIENRARQVRTAQIRAVREMDDGRGRDARIRHYRRNRIPARAPAPDRRKPGQLHREDLGPRRHRARMAPYAGARGRRSRCPTSRARPGRRPCRRSRGRHT